MRDDEQKNEVIIDDEVIDLDKFFEMNFGSDDGEDESTPSPVEEEVKSEPEPTEPEPAAPEPAPTPAKPKPEDIAKAEEERRVNRESQASSQRARHVARSIVLLVLGGIVILSGYMNGFGGSEPEQIDTVAYTPAPPPAPVAPPPEPELPSFLQGISLPLYRGVSGDDVTRLQTYLNEIGGVHSGIRTVTADGIFDDVTLRAVFDFQRITGLVPNGFVCETAWEKIYHVRAAPRDFDLPFPVFMPDLPAVYTVIAGVNFRTGPATRYDIIGSIPLDTRVLVIGHRGNWHRIEHDGRVGYASANFLRYGDYP